MKHYILCGFFSGQVVSGYYPAESRAEAETALKKAIKDQHPDAQGLMVWTVAEFADAPTQLFQVKA